MNNKVSRYQVGMLLFLLYCSLYIGLGGIILLRKSGDEILISMILGVIIGYIPLGMYLKVNSSLPKCNIYEKNTRLFGNFLGKILNTLILIIYICFYIIAIREIVIFSASKYLQNTPYFILGLLVIITSLIICFKGLECIFRISRLSFIATIIFIIIIEVSVLKYVEIGNIFPMLTGNNYIKDILSGAIFEASSCSILTVLLFTIRKDDIIENEKYNKTAIIFYTISGISLIIVMFLLLTCFAHKLSTLFRYPEYIGLKKIGFSSSELHLENLLAFRWIFYMLSLSLISLYGIKCGIENFVKDEKKVKWIVIIISVIAAILSEFILGNINHSIIIIKNYYTLFLALPLFIILTIIFIRCLMLKNKS